MRTGKARVKLNKGKPVTVHFAHGVLAFWSHDFSQIQTEFPLFV